MCVLDVQGIFGNVLIQTIRKLCKYNMVMDGTPHDTMICVVSMFFHIKNDDLYGIYGMVLFMYDQAISKKYNHFFYLPCDIKKIFAVLYTSTYDMVLV